MTDSLYLVKLRQHGFLMFSTIGDTRDCLLFVPSVGLLHTCTHVFNGDVVMDAFTKDEGCVFVYATAAARIKLWTFSRKTEVRESLCQPGWPLENMVTGTRTYDSNYWNGTMSKTRKLNFISELILIPLQQFILYYMDWSENQTKWITA